MTAKHQHDLGVIFQKRHRTLHHIHAYKQQAETNEPDSDLLMLLVVAHYTERCSESHAETSQIGNVKRHQLCCDRCTYIGTQNDADGLSESHKTHVDKANHYDRRSAAALQDAGNRRPQQQSSDRRSRQRAYQLPQAVSCQYLQGVTHNDYAVNKNADSCDYLQKR